MDTFKLTEKEEEINEDNEWLEILKKGKTEVEGSRPKKIDARMLNSYQQRAIGR
jgi:hypothetical protein